MNREQISKTFKIYLALTDEWQDVKSIAKNANIDDLTTVSSRVSMFVSFGTAERRYPIYTKHQMYRKIAEFPAEARLCK